MLNPDPPKVITDDPSETSSVQRQLFHSRTNGSPPRVALITGAGQGIGRAISCRLAQDGYNVAVNDIPSNKAALAETAEMIRAQTQRQTLEILGDVSSEDDVKGMIDTAVRQLGALDVMVANAGIAILQPIIESTTEAWQKTFDVNVKGVVLCYKYAALAMIKQGRGGRIIGASSIAGKRGDPNSAAYCASKFAVRGLSQSAAIELAPYGINVNCYAPGAIHTAFMDMVDEKYTTEEGTERGSYIKKRIAGIPLGRIGNPKDVAGLVSFLAGPDSKFITGQAITVDGGVLFD